MSTRISALTGRARPARSAPTTFGLYLDCRRRLGAPFLLPEAFLAHVSSHNVLGTEGGHVTGADR